MIFDKDETDWELFSCFVRLRLEFWLKGWDHSCPFNSRDVAYKLDCVRLLKERKEPRPTIAHNRLKWNVDGYSKGKPGAAGIGGVLRDEQRNVKAMLAASVGIKDFNEAEFMAIAFALEMSLLLKAGVG